MAAQNVGEKNRGSQLQEFEEDFTNWWKPTEKVKTEEEKHNY